MSSPDYQHQYSSHDSSETCDPHYGVCNTSYPSNDDVTMNTPQHMTRLHTSSEQWTGSARQEQKTDTDAGAESSTYGNVLAWLNQQACGGTVRRKRRITRPQRVAANVRERRRMVHLNTAFDELRAQIPIFPNEKRLSRIQTLRLARDYIGLMTEMIHGEQYLRTRLKDVTEKDDGKHYW